MPDPSDRRFIFEKIADDLSGGKARQKNRISNLLVSDLWDGKFDPQKLCWNVYNALLVLDPDELPDDTPSSPVYDAEKRADAQTIPLEPHKVIAGLDELETESLVRRANAISGGEKFTGQSDRVALILFLLDRGRNEQAPVAVTKSAPVKPAGPKQAPGVAEDMTGDDVSKLFENTTEGDEAKENSSRSDDFQKTSLEELYGLLSIVGEPLASDKANFPRLAQFELNQYIAASQVILMNVAIPADKVRCFCDRHDLKRLKRYERALTPETQPQNRPKNEAGLASNTLHTQSQSETAKLRKRLTKWIEEFAATDEAKGLVKAEFFQRARGEVDLRIPYWMFREAWSAAEIPAAFKKAGPRLKRTSE